MAYTGFFQAFFLHRIKPGNKLHNSNLSLDSSLGMGGDEATTEITLKRSLANIKQLLDEVEHDIMNYQNRGLCYLPKPKAEADNTDTRF